MEDYHSRRDKYENQDPSMYYVRDFGLAATLVIYGMPIAGYDIEEPKRVQIMFEKSQQLSELVRRYWDNDLEVYSLEHWNMVRSIKQSAFSQNIN